MCLVALPVILFCDDSVRAPLCARVCGENQPHEKEPRSPTESSEGCVPSTGTTETPPMRPPFYLHVLAHTINDDLLSH